MFDISTADDFYEKIVKPQYQDFLDNNSSSRYALLSILVTYHLYEWVGDKVKFDKNAFLERYPDFETEAEYFEVARRICNDTKHFNKGLRKKLKRGLNLALARFFQIFMRDHL